MQEFVQEVELLFFRTDHINLAVNENFSKENKPGNYSPHQTHRPLLELFRLSLKLVFASPHVYIGPLFHSGKLSIPSFKAVSGGKNHLSPPVVNGKIETFKITKSQNSKHIVAGVTIG